jgi:hypothetical protein
MAANASNSESKPYKKISLKAAQGIRERMKKMKEEMEHSAKEYAEFKKEHNDREQDESGKSVIPLIIQGHGSEYEYQNIYTENGKINRVKKAPESEHTFILPPNCYVVTSMDAGKRESLESNRYTKIHTNICRMPYEVIKNPLKYHVDEIYNAFGFVTIYQPGRPCPNFGYELISYFNKLQDFNSIGFTDYGSGVIPIKKLRSTFCKHKNRRFEGKTFEDADKYLLHFFKDSIYPTPEQVQDSIITFKKELPQYISKIKDTTGLIGYTESMLNGIFAIRYLHAMFYHFKNNIRHLFYRTQQKLCEDIATDPTKTYVFYNFICRAVPESDRFFKIINENNVLFNNLSHNELYRTNPNYKKLILRKISNVATSRRNQSKHIMNRKYPMQQSSESLRSTKKSPRSAANARSPKE